MREPRKIFLLSCLLVLTTFLVYKSVLHYGFIELDDEGYVVDNAHVYKGLTISNLGWAFTTQAMANWHPLTWISHMLDCEIYGRSPYGHHLTSLLLHIANALLLFLVLWKMTLRVWPAFFVSVLFSLHPLHVESVVWISERKDVLSTFFALLALFMYSDYVRSKRHYLLMVLFYLLALMSKPMVVTLPLLLLLLDVWPLDRLFKKTPDRDPFCLDWPVIREKIPLVLLSAGSCMMTFWAQSAGGAVKTVEKYSILDRIVNTSMSYVIYIKQMFWPFQLACHYPHPGKHGSLGVFIAPAGILILLTVLFTAVRRRRPYLMAGWLWYLVALVPAIGLVQVGSQAHADRYTYLPLIGLFIASTWGISQWAAPSRAKMMIVFIGALTVLMICALATAHQINYWKSGYDLFGHALEVSPGDSFIHFKRGRILLSLGRRDEALKSFQDAVKNEPDYVLAHLNLGLCLYLKGSVDDAVKEYRWVLSRRPSFADAYYDLALAYEKLGQPEEAIKAYRQALRFKSGFSQARYNLGLLFEKWGKITEARESYQRALKKYPDPAKIQNALGRLCVKEGKDEEAIQAFQEALMHNPKSAQAYQNIGFVLARQKKYGDAIVSYQKALGLNSRDANTYNNLGIALVKTRRFDEATTCFSRALAIKNDFEEARRNLSQALVDKKKEGS